MSDPCDQLEELKKLFEDHQSTHDVSHDVFFKSIRDKLYSMLRSPLKEDYYKECFKWIATISLTVGDFGWLSSNNNWTNEDAKIFSCIARLSINEIHILLPLTKRHLTDGDKPDLEDGKLMTRSANSKDYDDLGNHFVILESTIKSLIKGQDDDDDTDTIANVMNNEELRGILEHLKEIMLEICDYLEVVHQNWSSLTQKLDSEMASSAEGALRIMSVWLSEEPDGFLTQCKKFLIDLIIKNLMLPGRLWQGDILILALHSVCMQNECLLKELKQNTEYKKALQEYLNHVQQDKEKSIDCDKKDSKKQSKKMFRLRCGLIKDLLTH